MVLDVTVVSGLRMRAAWDLKIRKYGDEDSHAALKALWGLDVGIDHLPVVISNRGLLYGPTGRGLRRLGLSTRDIMDLCLCAMQGSMSIYDVYMKGN
ncbi:MAG: hypothetical protein ACRCT2_17105 [Plesiomonas shigelloides]